MDPIKMQNEIQSFQNIWHGGFRSGHDDKRNQRGIEAYVTSNLHGQTILEIGCGGGQWSKFLYSLNRFDKIYCIDVLSAQHNQFWEFVGHEKADKIEYTQVTEFSLSHIPDNSLDCVFSYDVFCHISKSAQNEYLKALSKKCKQGAKLFVMYADADKYFVSEPQNIHIQQKEQNFFGDNEELKKILIEKSDSDPYPPGRWYWIGINGFIEQCEQNGFTILERDLNIDKTNPISLFQKP
jgi:ubiquinone/menaquinone biosynthesis C-methylase UbiE